MRARGAEGVWLELVAELMSTLLVDLPVEQIALQMNRTFRSTGCAFLTTRADGSLEGGLYADGDQLDGLKAEIGFWSGKAGSRFQPVREFHPMVRLNPIRLHFRATGRAALLQIADVPDRFVDDESRRAWLDVANPWRCVDQLAIPLSASGERTFVLARDRRFSPEEMELAGRVWRVAVGLDRQARALRQVRASSAAVTEVRLTPRELAVLAQLADGRTAASIGRRLAMSTRTVHKHLEHIYAKLGVSDRLSAVLRARDASILPGRSQGTGDDASCDRRIRSVNGAGPSSDRLARGRARADHAGV
jgi:DNA-binding CsgD family transcriptional regulator